MDNLDPGVTFNGVWLESGASDEYAGSSRFNKTQGNNVRFTPSGLTAATYEVYAWWSGTQSGGGQYDRDSAAQFDIHHNGTMDTVIVDQDDDHGDWYLLGTYVFSGTGGEYVRLTASSQASVHGASADAIRWVMVS